MNNLTGSALLIDSLQIIIQPYVDSIVQWDNGTVDGWRQQDPKNILWIFLPVIIVFAVPVLLPLFVYGETIFLHMFEFWNKKKLQKIGRDHHTSSFFDDARIKIAAFLDGFACFWNGYEVKGLEHLPDEGPALLISYHGTSPLELWYFMCRGMLAKRRMIHCVGDQFCFKMPGWGKACKVLGITPGTIEDCVSTLREGKILIIAPGGVKEALFADETYQMMWENRCGYAKVIKETSVPVIPMFTENCREIFRTPKIGQGFFRMLYEKTRWPLCPLYGGFPVKLVTHLGTPINFSATTSPEQIKHSVEVEVKKLIKQNQVLPGSILRGISQRFCSGRVQD
ncbi:acyltransferase domain-containing protein [Ditylenchus destructor]|nr:acyltransferase domain-containing protein [Ditylenchus destructor]